MGADVECRRPHFNKSSFCLLGQNFWVGEELAGRRQRQDWVEGRGERGGWGEIGDLVLQCSAAAPAGRDC